METQHTKPPAYEDFARQVRAWRGKRTQAQAAEELGMSLTGFCSWEQGRRMPKGYALKLVLAKIASAPMPQTEPATHEHH